MLVLALCLLSLIAYSQGSFTKTKDLYYQISPVPGFKKSVVSFTFDDGYLNQFRIGLPLLKEYNLPATFYLITGLLDSLTRKTITDNLTADYEIGSHTVTHADLANSVPENIDRELVNSRKTIQDYFGNANGLTLCYPWGLFNGYAKKSASVFYMGARSADIGYNSLNHFDRYAIKMQGFSENTKPDEANSWVDYAITNHLWLVEMIHGIDGEGFSPVSSLTLGEHLRYVCSNDSLIWCSTVANYIKYFEESQVADITCDECSDTVYKIRINDYLDDAIYNQPLSVMIKVPESWSDINVLCKNHNEKVSELKPQYVTFDALPDGNQIIVRPSFLKDYYLQESYGLKLLYLTANPFIDELRITLEALNLQDIEVGLFDLNGMLLINQSVKSVEGIFDTYLETSKISSGIYILRIISLTDKVRFIKKMVKI